ncbi:hypothetical protein GCM10007103_33780 [Salinimicrobium marinum]|uniref:Glycosyl transferase family 1 domain-containing protein n=1 Tax=Salinimicrobium marinum TaxID=680283 RepID=A0A918SL41_9FLAO|nr:glycosyltransferase family 4 protein [Salinimicrobium marinum]GHA50296.1 hypothetical protein GCM10007103_33780 [Salinimicrobium marinum]
MKANLLYIGNRLLPGGGSPTSVDVLPPLFRQEGYNIKSASSRKNKLFRLADMLLTVFRNRKSTDFVLIDTYSTQNFWYAWAVARLCQKLKLKYIPILHGGELPKRLNGSPKACSEIFSCSYLNVAPSLYLKTEFQKAGFLNIRYIPNSIHLTDYKFKERRILAPKLLWVRAFDEIYNPMLALKVLEILLKKYPEAELCMVGPAKDESLNSCRRYALQNKLPVKFPGKLSKENWRTLSEGYDIFLNTTNIDNTPVSVLEAMALGLPVVSTNVGGLPYLISADVDGVLVPPNDPERMAGAVEKLLNDPEFSLKMTKTARKKTEAFDWEVVKEKWNMVLKP